MSDSLNSGPECCILGLRCCPPPPGGLTVEGARKVHLAKKMQSICKTLSDEDAFEMAEGILTDYDLVPVGVGKAIAEGYSQFIKKGG